MSRMKLLADRFGNTKHSFTIRNTPALAPFDLRRAGIQQTKIVTVYGKEGKQPVLWFNGLENCHTPILRTVEAGK
jgi:hypothetical protein